MSRAIRSIFCVCVVASTCSFCSTEILAQRRKAPTSPAPAKASKLPVPIPKEVAAQVYDKFGASNDAAAHWKYILDTLSDYEANTAGTPYNVFAKQMLGLAQLSFANRQEKGGWAGVFIRISFLVAALDIADHPELWNNRLAYISSDEDEVLTVAACGSLQTKEGRAISTIALDICGPMALGVRHYKRHLVPVFEGYIQLLFENTAQQSLQSKRVDNLIQAWLNLRKEHQPFINDGVIPTFDNNKAFSKSIWDFFRKASGKVLVSFVVEDLREKTINKVLNSLVEKGLLTNQELSRINLGTSRIVPIT